MLLCVSTTDGRIDFLRPPKGSNPGDRVSFGDFVMNPDKELNSKKNPWDDVKLKIKTNSKGLAYYGDDSCLWKTENGNAYSSLLDGVIS